MLIEEQIVVSEHIDGHAIIRAVAGSGKTTTICALAKRLVEKGVLPQRITFVVFNKDARRDITSKLMKSGMDQSNIPKVHTFHSLAYSLYSFLSKKGFIDFHPLQSNENFIKKFSQRCLNEVKSSVEKKQAYASKEEAEAFLNFIDIAKSTLLPTEEAFEIWIGNERYKHFTKAFENFESQRKNAKFITFSDLIKDIVTLCNKNEYAKSAIKGHVDYLLMDEVQDINEVSIELARIISESKTNWIMVGDVDQCIYGWRGAEPEYLSHRLKDELSKTGIVKEYELPYTFRYGHKVSLLANFLVRNNSNRSGGLCISATDKETSCDIKTYMSGQNFGKETLEVIKKEQKKGIKLSDIGVLVRLYSFSSEIELELLKNNIPYELQGGQTIFNKREINALIAVLKISNKTFFNESDASCSQQLNDLFSLCFFGVKLAINENVIRNIKEGNVSLSDFILSFKESGHSKFKKGKLQDLATSVKSIENTTKEQKPETTISTFIKYNNLFNLIDLFSVKQEDVDSKIYTINSFIGFIRGLKLSASETLTKLKELSDIKNTELDRVLISSIHRAKGREWKVVIMPGLEDGLFPYTKKDSDFDIESERRLFYVGITRCINHLYLICPYEEEIRRATKGESKTTPIDSLASRFIYESQPFLVSSLSKNLSKDNTLYKETDTGKNYIDKVTKK